MLNVRSGQKKLNMAHILEKKIETETEKKTPKLKGS